MKFWAEPKFFLRHIQLNKINKKPPLSTTELTVDIVLKKLSFQEFLKA